MNRMQLLLTSSGHGGVQFHEMPPWHDVEDQLTSTFNSGGSVQLAVCEKVVEPRKGNIVLESLSMEAFPGKCRLIVTPRRVAGTKSNLRTWWELGDAPFRGTLRFLDDEFDLRAVCSQFHVVRELFLDFFEHQGVSESLVLATYTALDKNPFLRT